MRFDEFYSVFIFLIQTIVDSNPSKFEEQFETKSYSFDELETHFKQQSKNFKQIMQHNLFSIQQKYRIA